MNTITVDINGAADLLKVHPKTVLDLIGAGALPAAKIGRSYVLMTKDVVNYIEVQLVRQMAERMGGPATRKTRKLRHSQRNGLTTPHNPVP